MLGRDGRSLRRCRNLMGKLEITSITSSSVVEQLQGDQDIAQVPSFIQQVSRSEDLTERTKI